VADRPPGVPEPARESGAADAGGKRAARPVAPIRRKRSGGVSVIAGGLLQDLEDRLRRDLPPIEERVRHGEEARGLVGGAGELAGGAADSLVIVLPDRD
jgi:hypothetical protein